jgi:predicted transcriptional regulator
MQFIRRQITTKAKNIILELKHIGINSNEVLTLVCLDENAEECLLNIKDSELHKLIQFLKKHGGL